MIKIYREYLWSMICFSLILISFTDSADCDINRLYSKSIHWKKLLYFNKYFFIVLIKHWLTNKYLFNKKGYLNQINGSMKEIYVYI